jgi:structure-specific recognition protein 1
VYISNVYKSERGDQCVKCSYKTNDGLLFPLQKLLIFIHKPTLVLRYDDVESVEFLRYAINALSASKNFDLLFKLKASASQGGEKDILFSGIDRSEFTLLHTFFSSKKLSIKADEGTPGESILDAIGQDVDEDEDESEDEEYQAKSSSSGSEDEEEGSGGEEEAMAAVASPSKKEKVSSHSLSSQELTATSEPSSREGILRGAAKKAACCLRREAHQEACRSSQGEVCRGGQQQEAQDRD